MTQFLPLPNAQAHAGTASVSTLAEANPGSLFHSTAAASILPLKANVESISVRSPGQAQAGSISK